ncbi:M15 family metallopeptidase [Candidatus Saccharibacteria bacterium]|nr:M15 family metallopeptidase [Candidatus Saccharibacteria bacterium]
MKLVNLSDYGIQSMNYYWERMDNFNISKDELINIGITGDCAQVDVRLVPRLKQANKILKKHGYEIIVKDGYRSKELYDLVRRKRYENDGKEVTDNTLSTGANPHSTGLAIDVNLVRLDDGVEVEIRDKDDWPNSIFKDYYRNKADPKSIEYQRLQDLLADTMTSVGFLMGKRNEFHHFELDTRK